MLARAKPVPVAAWSAVAALAVAGLVLRLLAADGALWTDEAWSALHAAEVQTPLGVFLWINHDNNHHLYSLWLQAIGLQASPLLARAPAIVAGTLAILVAAMIGARRSAAAAIVAAALFAVAPILVVYGSEARGYAPMILAALAMLLLVDRWLEGDTAEPPTLGLALLAFLGTLSHLTMVAPVGLLTLWVYCVRRAADGPDAALRSTARVMGPALAAAALVVAGVIAAAQASPTGMQVGGYAPFTAGMFATALDELIATTLGLSLGNVWLGPLLLGLAVAVLALRPPQWIGRRRWLYPLLILAVPVAVGLLHVGNSGFARYYLPSALGLLLIASEWLGRGIGTSDRRRWLSLAALAVVLGAGLWRDSELIRLQRGEPGRPLETMAKLAPGGATVAFAEERLRGVMLAAAARSGYRFTTATGCAPAQFLLGARNSASRVRPMVVRCGVRMRAIAYGNTGALSGEGWALYRAEALQSR